MDEVGVLVVDVEDILKHAENQTRDCKNFFKGIEANFLGYGDKKGNSKDGKEYPPFVAPIWGNKCHKNR